MFSTLKKRLIVSGILIAILSLLLLADHYLTSMPGQTGFYLIVAVTSSLCFYEFTKLYANINIKLPWLFPVIIGVLGIGLLWALQAFQCQCGLAPLFKSGYLPALFTSFLFLIGAIIYYLKRVQSFPDLLILSMGFFYIYIAMWSILSLRELGIMPVLYFIAIVKLSDSIAYFCGTIFGKHKLAEHISPNKTVEGFVGTMIITPLLGLILFYFILSKHLLNDLTIFVAVLFINFVIVFIAQIGDLAESYIKRKCQVKDSGKVLGPLGGILDLTDSLLLAAPPAAFLLIKVIELL